MKGMYRVLYFVETGWKTLEKSERFDEVEYARRRALTLKNQGIERVYIMDEYKGRTVRV